MSTKKGKKEKHFHHNIRVQLGIDTHRMEKNEQDRCYCSECSLRSMCFEMGVTSRKNFCEAVLIETYEDDYRKQFSPYGGHFVMNQPRHQEYAKKEHSTDSVAT